MIPALSHLQAQKFRWQTSRAAPVTGAFWRFVITLLLVSILSILPASADISLTFGTYTADKPSSTVRKFRPVLNTLEKMLSQRLGETVKIRSQISATYGDGVKALTEGKVDFARFGPASYIAAKRDNSGIKLLAMEAVNGAKTFNGVICVRKNSAVHKLRDLRGKSFAFGSRMSTIGRYLSQKALIDAGITAKALAKFSYLGRHDSVGTAVSLGFFDAGALKESTFRKLLKNKHQLEILTTFENVTKPWIARAGLPEEIREALSQALLNMQNPDALKRLKKSGFLPAQDTDYDPIRAAMKASREFKR